MMRSRVFLPVMALLIGTAILGAPNAANAAFQLRYSTTGTGGPFTTITDGGVGDLDPTVGSIFTSTVAGLGIHASSTNFISPSLTTLDLQVSGTANGSALNLAVQSSITGITTAPPPQNLSHHYTGSILPPGTATSSAETWVSQVNTTFTTSPSVAHTGPLAPGGTGAATFSASVPYSMTTQILVTGTAPMGSQLSLDSNNAITPAPAPAALVLALTGMPFLGAGAWLRRRRAQIAA
jgi:hypothetical protein